MKSGYGLLASPSSPDGYGPGQDESKQGKICPGSGSPISTAGYRQGWETQSFRIQKTVGKHDTGKGGGAFAKKCSKNCVKKGSIRKNSKKRGSTPNNCWKNSKKRASIPKNCASDSRKRESPRKLKALREKKAADFGSIPKKSSRRETWTKTVTSTSRNGKLFGIPCPRNENHNSFHDGFPQEKPPTAFVR